MGAECGFDYSTLEAQEAIRETLPAILAIREELHDPAMARRVGRDERRYERSLGLAVAPLLLWRAVRGPQGGREQDRGGGMPDLLGQIRQELEHDSISPKMALYERSLGLAVIPVLIRRAYKRRVGPKAAMRP
jgi:hypothetical protein